jgi:hypothetical protein
VRDICAQLCERHRRKRRKPRGGLQIGVLAFRVDFNLRIEQCAAGTYAGSDIVFLQRRSHPRLGSQLKRRARIDLAVQRDSGGTILKAAALDDDFVSVGARGARHVVDDRRRSVARTELQLADAEFAHAQVDRQRKRLWHRRRLVARHPIDIRGARAEALEVESALAPMQLVWLDDDFGCLQRPRRSR